MLNLTASEIWGYLLTGGAFTGLGWLIRRVVEKRRHKALDAQEEERVRQLHLSNDGVEVHNFETLWKRTSALAGELLIESRRTRECEQREADKDIRIRELESTNRHLTETLQAEVQKTAAKESELVGLRRQKMELEERLERAQSSHRGR